MNLYKERELLEGEINDRHAKIDNAKVILNSTGQYTDPALFMEWRREIRELTTKLHQMNRKIREENKLQQDRLYNFRKNAKIILSDDTFKQIEEMQNEETILL